MCGDLYFRILHKGSVKDKLICRFALNTSFTRDNKCSFTKFEVDPDSISRKSNFDDNFKVDVFFKDCCSTCNPQMDLESICEECVSMMGEEQIKSWRLIKDVLQVSSNVLNGYIDSFIPNI